MAGLSEDEKRLIDLLVNIKRDELFVHAMYSLADECDAVKEIADAIEEFQIQTDQELYSLLFGEDVNS